MYWICCFKVCSSMTPKSTFISIPVAICITTVAIFPMVPRSLSQKDAVAECFFSNLLLSANKSYKLIYSCGNNPFWTILISQPFFAHKKRRRKKHLQYTSSTGLQFIQCLEFCVKNKLVLFLSFFSVKEEKAVRIVFIPHSSTFLGSPISGKIVTSAILGVTYLID